MKVSNDVTTWWPRIGRLSIAIPLALAILSGTGMVPAHAITRTLVIKRADTWIHRRVKYSQRGYYHGYRRDCSGFVSMAWKLKKSYTSSTIRSRARTISWRALKPGDAVRRSGHVEIFGGWKNKGRRQYWSLEESTYGKPALRHLKLFRRGSAAWRLRGIQDAAPAKRRAPAPGRKPPVVVPAPPSTETTLSVPTSAPAPRSGLI